MYDILVLIDSCFAARIKKSNVEGGLIKKILAVMTTASRTLPRGTESFTGLLFTQLMVSLGYENLARIRRNETKANYI
jgi:hypothetical protein